MRYTWQCVGHEPTQWILHDMVTMRYHGSIVRLNSESWCWSMGREICGEEPSRECAMEAIEKRLGLIEECDAESIEIF